VPHTVDGRGGRTVVAVTAVEVVWSGGLVQDRGEGRLAMHDVAAFDR